MLKSMRIEEWLGRDASRDFGVIARTSVMHYKNSHSGMEEIARALQVQYALPSNWVATVGYQGSSSHDLLRIQNLQYF